MMKRLGFSKSARLLKSSEFDRVMNLRQSRSDQLVIVYAARNDGLGPRLGLIVSRKCGNAVVRSRWKRALREAFRLVRPELPDDIDLVVLPRKGGKPQVRMLQDSLKTLAGQLAERLPASTAQRTRAGEQT